MPNPLLPFDPTKPGDTDYRNVFPALDRGDKTTLTKVLGTLAPFGSPTTAWRNTQIGNISYLTQNASWNGSAWLLDDTTVPASGIEYDPSDRLMAMLWSPAGTSPFASWLYLGSFQAPATGTPAPVNSLVLAAAWPGNPPQILAGGTDANVGVNVQTKGTGILTLNGQGLAQASATTTGYLRLGPITLQWGQATMTVATANTWTTITVTLPVAFSVATFSVTANIAGNPVVPLYGPTTGSTTTTGFQLSVNYASTGTLYVGWIAVGAT